MTSASISTRCARSVSRSSAPGPAPTSQTRPSLRSGDCNRRLAASRAESVSPRATASATAPEKNRRQKLRRNAPLGTFCSATSRYCTARRASLPSDGDSIWSMRARIIWARTGPAPSVPMAMATGARATSAGVKKSQNSGWSTALAGIFFARAAVTISQSSASFPVAAKTSVAPSISWVAKPKAR
ncbi:hypothetical protein D3C71_1348370 [compost metagenome]